MKSTKPNVPPASISETPPTEPTPQAWRPRFGIGGIMLITLVCSVMAASGYYLVQAQQKQAGDSSANRLGFMLFTLSAPMLVLIVVSLIWSLTNRRRMF